MDAVEIEKADDPGLATGRRGIGDWRIASAVLGLGLWLVCASPDETAEVLAPPGVPMTPAGDGRPANVWRRGIWSTPGRFGAGLVPDEMRACASVGEVLDALPSEFRDWVLEASERHVEALERGAALRAGDPRPKAAARAAALSARADSERADIARVVVRIDHDPLLQSQLARLIEAASTARGVADSLGGVGLAPAELESVQATMRDLSNQVAHTTGDIQSARDSLARELSLMRYESREYRIAMASRSWQLTRPFRWFARTTRAAVTRASFLADVTRVLSREPQTQQ